MNTYNVDIEAKILNQFTVEANSIEEASQKAKDMLLEENDVADIYYIRPHKED